MQRRPFPCMLGDFLSAVDENLLGSEAGSPAPATPRPPRAARAERRRGGRTPTSSRSRDTTAVAPLAPDARVRHPAGVVDAEERDEVKTGPVRRRSAELRRGGRRIVVAGDGCGRRPPSSRAGPSSATRCETRTRDRTPAALTAQSIRTAWTWSLAAPASSPLLSSLSAPENCIACRRRSGVQDHQVDQPPCFVGFQPSGGRNSRCAGPMHFNFEPISSSRPRRPSMHWRAGRRRGLGTVMNFGPHMFT